MSSIDNIKIGNTKYDLKDSASGYGVFSAEQVMQSTVTGATLVGTLKYRTYSPANKTFGTTTSVNLYSTPGAIEGNRYNASVSGNILNISSVSVSMVMPDLTGYSGITVYDDVLDALKAAGIITLHEESPDESVAQTVLTANCNLQFSYYSHVGVQTLIDLATGETTTIRPGVITNQQGFYQTPAPNTVLDSTSTVIVNQIPLDS